jgi:hypothetical protein
MVTILLEANQRSVPEVAKKHGVCAQTIYGWRKHFGTLEPDDVKQLRQLEQERGCASHRCDAGPGRPGSAVRLSEDSHLPGRGGGPGDAVVTARPRPVPPTGRNHVGAYDFVFDRRADGRALECLVVVDEYTRECLASTWPAGFGRGA